MNLIINKEKIYVNQGNEKILLSLQVNGGKNLDGTYKPSGFLKVRPVKEAAGKLIDILGVLQEKYGKLPKYIVVYAEGFLTYEEYDAKDGKHKNFVAVIDVVNILGDSEQAEENQKKPLNF